MSCHGSPLSTWMAAHAPGHCHLHVTVEGTPDWTLTCPWSCPHSGRVAPASSRCTWHPLLPRIWGARYLGRPQTASHMARTGVSRPVGHPPAPVGSRVAISEQFEGAQLRSKVSGGLSPGQRRVACSPISLPCHWSQDSPGAFPPARGCSHAAESGPLRCASLLSKRTRAAARGSAV